jgi:hypothetical protein
MYSHNSERKHITTDGLTLVIVPRPSLETVKLDAKGVPSSVLYPNSHYLSDGWTYYSTLKGINKADYDRLKPDLVMYQLADGTLLQADLELFVGSEMVSHNATQKETFCYSHQVNQLRVVEMPEIEEVQIWQF